MSSLCFSLGGVRCRPLALVLAAVAPIGGGVPAQAGWTPAPAPSGRAEHAMAYDLARREIVLHGGELPGSVPPRYLGDTWIHDGTAWREVTASGGPGLRSGHAMAYDLVRQRVVLFGGFDGSALRDDTWEWDGTAWTRIATPVAPTPRSDHAMAYDPLSGRVILFGGADGSGLVQDTWGWDGTTWRPLAPPGALPAPRRNHALAAAIARGGVVMYGGAGIAGTPHNDTWLWSAGAWVPIGTATIPPALSDHCLVADLARSRTVLFGGYGALGGGFGLSDQTWVLGPTDWVRQTPAVAPPARAAAAAVFDVGTGETVVIGGNDAGVGLSDAWAWDGTNWALRTGNPRARSGHALSAAPGGDGVVLFGGFDGVRSFLSDTWVRRADGWVTGPAGPSARRFHAMALDPVRARVVLFGGFDGTTRLADTWEFDGTSWRQIATATVPPARDGHALAWDPVGRRILMFGGFDVGARNDTWAYDGADWRQLMPPTSPPPRTRHAMAEDPLRSRVVLFGGADAAVLGDTWLWDGATWRAVNPPATPAPRLHHAMAWNAARARVVLTAGGPGAVGDTWEWDGATWRAAASIAPLPPRTSHGVAYDAAREVVVAFGGENASLQRSDTWVFGSTPTASYRSFGSGCAGASGTPRIDHEPFSRPWLGDVFTVRATNLAPNQRGVFMFTGFSDAQSGGIPLPLSLAFAGMPGCSLLVELVVSYPMTPAGGDALWTITLPNTQSLAGAEFFNQALVLEPGANPAGAVTTAARRAVIGRR